MQLIKQKVEILYCDDNFLKLIEKAGRLCYKSEAKITPDSYKSFIRGIIKRGHESVIEHSLLTVKFICDRGISHELVRHRLASFSQISTRYVNYSKRGIKFIVPYWYNNIWDNISKINDGLRIGWDISEVKISCGLTEEESDFLEFLKNIEDTYNKMVKVYSQKPEQARAVLPNCLATELVMSGNFREWRHILKLRSSSKAHPQIRELMIDLYNKLRLAFPEIFDIIFADVLRK